MNRLAGIVLHVEARNAEGFFLAIDDFAGFRPFAGENPDNAMLAKRTVELGNLISLGQIRVEIVLSCKNRRLVDLAPKRNRSLHGHRDSLPVNNRKGSRESEAYRTGICIRRGPELGAAATEQFAAREQLCVYFKTNYRFKFHKSIIEQ